MYQVNEKTVYICGSGKFPHGTASGNRMEYMAICLMEQGYEPVIVTCGKNVEEEYNPNLGLYCYDGIFYKNVSFSNNKKGKVEQLLFAGDRISKTIQEIGVFEGMPVIVCTNSPLTTAQLRKGLKKCHARFFYDAEEWVDDSNFKYGKLNPHCWAFKYCFEHEYATGAGVLAISKNIQKYFEGVGVPTYLYPVCLDVSKFKRKDQRSEDKVRFIYSGQPGNKEATDTMLEAFTLLTSEERQQVEMHYTGVSEKKIRAILGEKEGLVDDLKRDVLKFHSWMDYEELLALYHQVHALLIVRKKNRTTLSNFPSKVPELMSCGVFVVANDQGDFFEYLEDGVSAIKVEELSPEACATAIRRVLALPKDDLKKMSQEAIRCVEEKLSCQRFSKDLVDFLMEDRA